MVQRFVPSGPSAGGEARQPHGVRRQSEVRHGLAPRQTETEGREFVGAGSCCTRTTSWKGN